MELAALRFRHLAQGLVKFPRAQEKCSIQHAVDFAFQNAGLEQIKQPLDKHFRAAIKPRSKWRGVVERRHNLTGLQPRQQILKLHTIIVTQDQRLGDRIARRSNADL